MWQVSGYGKVGVVESEQFNNQSKSEEHPAEISERFKALMPALESYAFSILADYHAACDVVQETLFLVWQKRPDLIGEDLRAYCFRTVWFKCLAQQRDHGREPVVYFSHKAMQRISHAAEDVAEQHEQRMHALETCLKSLEPKELDLLKLRYESQHTLKAIAGKSERKASRLRKSLSRLRLRLRHCIETTLASQKQ